MKFKWIKNERICEYGKFSKWLVCETVYKPHKKSTARTQSLVLGPYRGPPALQIADAADAAVLLVQQALRWDPAEEQQQQLRRYSGHLGSQDGGGGHGGASSSASLSLQGFAPGGPERRQVARQHTVGVNVQPYVRRDEKGYSQGCSWRGVCVFACAYMDFIYLQISLDAGNTVFTCLSYSRSCLEPRIVGLCWCTRFPKSCFVRFYLAYWFPQNDDSWQPPGDVAWLVFSAVGLMCRWIGQSNGNRNGLRFLSWENVVT